MDHETLIESFRAERADRDPGARAAAWQALDARIRSAEGRAPAERRGRRRGLLALAASATAAAIVLAVLLVGSDSTTEPAVAAVLKETAAIAADGDGAPTLQAGPGQYYFTKTRALELRGWYADSYEVGGSPASRKGGFSALVPSTVELWMSPEGGNRVRMTFGTPEFRSEAVRERWEAAGSPLPRAYDPAHQAEFRRSYRGTGVRVLDLSRGVIDTERRGPKGGVEPGLILPDLSRVPTDPVELRRAIRERRMPGSSGGRPLGPDEVIEELTGLLARPNASPALRAATFDALAELPRIGLDREATDLAGRSGYAITYERLHGLRDEYIIDPETSRFLGERTVLTDPSQDPKVWKGYQPGLVTRDVAYLRSAVVDSTRSRR